MSFEEETFWSKVQKTLTPLIIAVCSVSTIIAINYAQFTSQSLKWTLVAAVSIVDMLYYIPLCASFFVERKRQMRPSVVSLRDDDDDVLTV